MSEAASGSNVILQTFYKQATTALPHNASIKIISSPTAAQLKFNNPPHPLVIRPVLSGCCWL
jgi:hypothetical protein